MIKIPFDSKEIYKSAEFSINFENNYVDDISSFLIDDKGNAKFVLYYRDYGVYHTGHFHEGMAYEGYGDIIIGQIINNIPDLYLIDRRMKVSLTQRVKGAGSRFDSGFFDFVNKDDELILLLNIGEFNKIDDHLLIANFLDKESQKFRDKKGFNRQLENIKTQAYVFKLGPNGLQYEAIEKNYDNNLAFERAYLNKKGEVIVSTGEYDSKQFVKMKF